MSSGIVDQLLRSSIVNDLLSSGIVDQLLRSSSRLGGLQHRLLLRWGQFRFRQIAIVGDTVARNTGKHLGSLFFDFLRYQSPILKTLEFYAADLQAGVG